MQGATAVKNMGFKCCVPKCRTGYASPGSRSRTQASVSNGPAPTSSNSVALFAFPSNSVMKDKWIRAIKRDDFRNGQRIPFEPSKYSRVCALHFSDDDFMCDSTDTNTTRLKKKSKSLKMKKLKPTAVPRYLQNCPSYLSKPKPPSRRSNATSEYRRNKENEASISAMEIMFNSETIQSIHDLKTKLPTVTLPVDFFYLISDASILFSYITSAFDPSGAPPVMRCGVRVLSDLSTEVFIGNLRLSHRLYNHVLSIPQRVSSTTELCNLLAFAKSSCDLHFANEASLLDIARLSIDQYLENEDAENRRFLQFVSEQLELSQTKVSARHYSPETIRLSFLWYITNRPLYLKLRELFFIPTVRRLQQLSSDTSVTTSNIDISYISARVNHLSDSERIVTLIIDEVYTAQRVECVKGRLTGLTESGDVGKTVLTFMVQSLKSKYKDVVKIVPVVSLNLDILYQHFVSVLKNIKELLHVIAVVVDNHPVNRSLYRKLCSGRLHPHVKNPVDQNKQLYLLFDSTHNLKNAFNNWLKREKFVLPSGHPTILTPGKEVHFRHLKELLLLEEGKPVKSAFKLTSESLNPSSISKTSPRHALRVFCESTYHALRFYSIKGWRDTSEFIEFIVRLWKILNVKSPSKGTHARDEDQSPIVIDDHRIDFLTESADWISSWTSSSRYSFSSETGLAWSQTLRAICALCIDLVNNHGFSYVLTGKLLSDPIEARFGCYRQMAGANYYMSMRQLLDAEKKIRVYNLLQSDSSSMWTTSKNSSSHATEDHLWLASSLITADIFDISDDDSSIIYYVAGYVGRGIAARNTCSSCQEILFQEIDNSRDDTCARLIQITSRGGLVAPTQYVFLVSSLSYLYYQQIVSDDELRQKWLTTSDHCQVFTNTVLEKLRCDDEHSMLLTVECSERHQSCEAIIRKITMCFIKNYMSQINDSHNDVDKGDRKLKKLKSQKK